MTTNTNTTAPASGDSAAGTAPREYTEALSLALEKIREFIAAGDIPSDGSVTSFHEMAMHVDHSGIVVNAIFPDATGSVLLREDFQSRCDELIAAIDHAITDEELALGLDEEQREAIRDCDSTGHYGCERGYLSFWNPYPDEVVAYSVDPGQIREGSFYLTRDPETASRPASGAEVTFRSTGYVISELMQQLAEEEDGTGTVYIRTADRETVLAQYRGTRDELIAYLAGLPLDL